MQLELFPALVRLPRNLPPWESLRKQQQSSVIKLLARLMSKTIHPHPRRDNDER